MTPLLKAVAILALISLALIGALAPGKAPAAPPVCADVAATLTFDHRYAIGSADFSDPDGDPESGSTHHRPGRRAG